MNTAQVTSGDNVCGDQGSGSEQDPGGTRLCLRPLLSCAGIFYAGFSLLLDGSNPLFTCFAPQTRGSFFLCLFLGIAISASLIMLLARNRMVPRLFETGLLLACLASFLIGFAPLVIVLSGGSTPFAIATVSACLLGIGVSSGALLWVKAFDSLSVRNVLFNGSFAVMMFAVVSEIAKLQGGMATSVADAACLLIGSCTSIAALYVQASPTTSSTTTAADAAATTASAVDTTSSPDRRSAPFKQLFLSVPVLGYLISMFTTGASLVGVDSTTSPSQALVAAIIAAIVLLITMSPLARKGQRLLGYLSYDVIVPAVAVAGLAIKMIPVDAITSNLFRDFMFCYFQLLAFATWTFVINMIRDSSDSAASVCCRVLIGMSIALAAGYGASNLEETPKLVIMGILTGAFLLYSVAALTRSVVLYAKSAESGRELAEQPQQTLDVDVACQEVSTRYRLSARESEVLTELAYGHASSYIAKVLYISENTARTHMKNIYKKLGVNSRDDLLEIIRDTQKEK